MVSRVHDGLHDRIDLQLCGPGRIVDSQTAMNAEPRAASRQVTLGSEDGVRGVDPGSRAGRGATGGCEPLAMIVFAGHASRKDSPCFESRPIGSHPPMCAHAKTHVQVGVNPHGDY